MKSIIPIIKTSFVLAVVSMVALSTTNPLGAQETSNQGLTEQKCILIKTSVQQVQRSDLEARIIRGRAYDNVLSLMASLNSRLALNNTSDPRMVEIANDLKAAFPEFIQHYSTYETSVHTLQNTDCKKQTDQFDDRLDDVRTKRDVLKDDVVRMRTLIDEYRSKVAQIKADLKQEVDSGDED